ncbi:MAG: rhodanese-like domain-containing protein [Bryobacteraceae bacterium]|nr:rhodanese-like domain-containing protein [Bryobacteraceae bacterium]
MRFPAILLYMTLAAAAQDSKMLTTTGQLASMLNDKSLVLLHVGSDKDFAEGHIPGARLVRLADISVTGEGGLRMQLPPVADLVKAFGRHGVTDTSRIVLYPAAESIQSATRVWFTLDYLGVSERASLLDGGLMLWKADGRPVTTAAPPEAKETTFKTNPNPDVVVDAAWLAWRLGKPEMKLQLFDARTPEFYSGANAGGMPRAGHIPEAVNVPYPTLVAEDRKLKPATELKSLLAAKADGPVVTYCHIGMQATVPYFVARYLGYSARMYDGSFQDWSSREELPVVGK